MFLLQLYSEPKKYFEPIEFKNGVNFIFGKKSATSAKESLNGIGKTTTLELIDFCLCAELSSKGTSRLYKEKEKIESCTVVLEFKIEQKNYIVKRAIGTPKKVEIGDDNSITEYDIKDARAKLCEIIFKNRPYSGVLDGGWFRSLIGFFVKIHKKTRNEFIDPILYLHGNSKVFELNQFHLFFMGIDNTLANKNVLLQNSVKDRDAAIREIKRMIEKNFQINIRDAQRKIDRLQFDLNKANELIESFKLAEQHKSVEVRLDFLTENIKNLTEINYWDKKRLESYQESYELKDTLSNSKIKSIHKLYNEISDELGSMVKKSLDEAVAFRKQISASREDFLKEEVNRLNKSINEKQNLINLMDEERSNLFKSLRAKEAFKDLKEAYIYLSSIQKDLVSLEARVKTYEELESEKNKWKIEDSQLKIDLENFLLDIQEKVDSFRASFNYVYDNIYPQNVSSGFSIKKLIDTTSKSKISINISFDSDESKGWNKGRTLVYDIAILLNAISQDLSLPRFLIHDGIFDGMDKAHFVHLYHFITQLSQSGTEFQYIVTLNEEGTLSQAFGNTDTLDPEQIANEAISVLTPQKKLWLFNN